MDDETLKARIEAHFKPDPGVGQCVAPTYGYRTCDHEKLPAIREMLYNAVVSGWYGRNGIPIGWRLEPVTVPDSDFGDKAPWKKCWLRVTYRMN